MSIEATRQARNMPWLKRGLHVEVNGKKGIVTAGDGNSIRVRFEGEKKSVSVHPWRCTRYTDSEGYLLAEWDEQIRALVVM